MKYFLKSHLSRRGTITCKKVNMIVKTVKHDEEKYL